MSKHPSRKAGESKRQARIQAQVETKRNEGARLQEEEHHTVFAQQPRRSFFRKLKTSLIYIVGSVILFWIGVAINILGLRDYIVEKWFTTDHDRFKKEETFEGNIRPIRIPRGDDTQSKVYSLSERPPVYSSSPRIDTVPNVRGFLMRNVKNGVVIRIGSSEIALSENQLIDGQEIALDAFGACESSKITLLLRGDRVYISLEFYDLEHEDLIGIIEYNHWRLYRNNLGDWHNDDTRFEVIDHKKNIVCSIYSDGISSLQVGGYFLTPTSNSILVLNNQSGTDNDGWHRDTCFSKDDSRWKEKVIKHVEDYVQSVFPPGTFMGIQRRKH